jgi:thymidine kinase
MSQLEGSELGSSATIDLVHSVKESVVKGHRTRMALSTIDSMEDIAHVIERNGTAQATMQVRSQAWLEENGKYL